MKIRLFLGLALLCVTANVCNKFKMATQNTVTRQFFKCPNYFTIQNSITYWVTFHSLLVCQGHSATWSSLKENHWEPSEKGVSPDWERQWQSYSFLWWNTSHQVWIFTQQMITSLSVYSINSKSLLSLVSVDWRT